MNLASEASACCKNLFLSTRYVAYNGKEHFGGKSAGTDCLGRPGNFEMCRGNLFGNFKMCRGNARLPNTVGNQICKKVEPRLLDLKGPQEGISVFHCGLCDISRTTEGTSTNETM